jgi:hypothetical protein
MTILHLYQIGNAATYGRPWPQLSGCNWTCLINYVFMWSGGGEGLEQLAELSRTEGENHSNESDR